MTDNEYDVAYTFYYISYQESIMYETTTKIFVMLRRTYHIATSQQEA